MSYDPEMIITLFRQWINVEYERHRALFQLSEKEDADYGVTKGRFIAFEEAKKKLEELEND